MFNYNCIFFKEEYAKKKMFKIMEYFWWCVKKSFSRNGDLKAFNINKKNSI